MLRAGGPEEMARLFTTHPTGTWVLCEDGCKTCAALLWTNSRHMSPCPYARLLGRASGTWLSIGRKATRFSGGAFHLEPARSMCGWAMSGLRKAVNLSFQGERKKKKKVPTICLSGKGRTMETMKRSMVVRSMQRDEYTECRSFFEGENTLNDIIMMDICHYTFVQAHRMCKTTHLLKVNPKMNRGPW